MKRFFTYLICSLTFTMMIARSEASGKFDIYLCIGQSNMAGRATLTPAVMDTLVNVYLFNDRNLENIQQLLISLISHIIFH